MNKIFVDIKNFILTGNFGGINVGMNRDQIINILGVPDWYGLGNDESFMTADMWTYGNIELYFNYNIPGTDKLGMLFIKNLFEIDGGNIFEFDFWLFKQGGDNLIDLDIFLLKLSEKNYNIVSEYDDQKLLVCNSGVTVGFNIDDETNTKFYASVVYLHYYDWVKNKELEI